MRAFLMWLTRYWEPDLWIGGRENPYLIRWWLLPRNRFPINIYLHRMLRSDDDRALHDHPWWFLSIILSGGYIEIRPTDEFFWNIVREYPAPNGNPDGLYESVWSGERDRVRTVRHRGGSFLWRPLGSIHRLVMPDDQTESWSLVITGRPVQEWGFYMPSGWTNWRDMVVKENGESVYA